MYTQRHSHFLFNALFRFLRKGKIIVCLYFVITIQSLFLIFIVIKYNVLLYIYVDMQHASGDPYYAPYSYFERCLMCMTFSGTIVILQV